jgi:hypothetical protein
VHDYAAALLKHLWQQHPVKANGREKILAQGALPLSFVKHREAAAWRR